jgi:hypothetical protein
LAAGLTLGAASAARSACGLLGGRAACSGRTPAWTGSSGH